MRGLGWWRDDVSGTLRLILAVVLGLAAVVLQVSVSGPLPALLVDAALFAVAAASRWWRTPAAIVLIVACIGLLARPVEWRSLGEYAVLLPVLGVVPRDWRWPWLLYTVAAVGLLTASVVRARGASTIPLTVTAWSVLFGIVWLMNLALAAVAAHQQQLRTNALAAQRQAIARDLHDTVAHGLSLMVMRAEQAKLRGGAGLPELDFIINTGQRSIQELRSMMVLMRDPDGAVDAAPETTWRVPSLLDSLDAFGRDLQDKGFVVNRVIEGDLATVPSAIAQASAKIAREACADIAKHGDPAQPCSIMAAVTADELDLLFLNAPRARPPLPSHQPLGVRGMQERAASVGGRVHSSAAGQQWVTRVSIPLGLSATPQAS